MMFTFRGGGAERQAAVRSISNNAGEMFGE
jgi:hypothetical protein